MAPYVVVSAGKLGEESHAALCRADKNIMEVLEGPLVHTPDLLYVRNLDTRVPGHQKLAIQDTGYLQIRLRVVSWILYAIISRKKLSTPPGRHSRQTPVRTLCLLPAHRWDRRWRRNCHCKRLPLCRCPLPLSRDRAGLAVLGIPDAGTTNPSPASL